MQAAATSTTPALVAKALVLGHFTSSVQNGRTVIRSSEAGGLTEFAFPDGLTPGEVIEVAGRALEWIEAQADPLVPALPRISRRLRFCFDRASL